MRITRIYFSDSLSIDTLVTLSEEAARHLSTVLRVQVGDAIVLFNGDGFDYSAVIEQIGKKSIQVKVLQKLANASSPTLKINLAQGICRGEKMDFVIQKATELGVSEITPIITEHGNVKLVDERWEKKIGHWQKVANSACEQSGRADRAVVNIPLRFNEFIQQNLSGEKFILSPTAKQQLPQQTQVTAVQLLVGPEGGFSETEINQAVTQGFTALQLGPRILRSETAGLASISIAQYLWGDLRAL